jgi:predicted ArsR family transcriptional regulator
MTTASVHRALADPRRARIIEELDAAPGGLDTSELARRLDVHANTVRFHLGVLADAGLVTGTPLRGERGRPRILYARTAGPPEPADEHRLLATILTGAVAQESDGPARAEQAGRAWGRYLAPKPLPLARLTDEDAAREVVGVLAEQGFEPEAAGDEIRMRRCPFHALAEQHPEVVCAVHRGLISGALDQLGSRLEVGDLEVFVEPDLCIARLRARARA